MTEVSARRAVTRDRLCEAAQSVFAEKGVLGASVEEICDAAGYTRGAFYSNFTSKDDLCIALQQRMYDEQMDALASAAASVEVGQDADLDTLIQQALRVFFASRAQAPEWIIASQELRLHAARSPEMGAAYREFHQRGTEAVAAVIAEVLGRLGYELVTSGPETMGILHAVHDHGALSALIGSNTIEGDAQQRLLMQLLRTIIRRRTPNPQ